MDVILPLLPVLGVALFALVKAVTAATEVQRLKMRVKDLEEKLADERTERTGAAPSVLRRAKERSETPDSTPAPCPASSLFRTPICRSVVPTAVAGRPAVAARTIRSTPPAWESASQHRCSDRVAISESTCHISLG